MDMLFRYNEAVLALENFLQVNGVDKSAKYSEDVLMIDMVIGYLESLLHMAVKPSYVTFDDYLCEILADYMVEV